MSSPIDIKQVVLTGSAATEMSGGTCKKERRQKQGGDSRKKANSVPVSSPPVSSPPVSSQPSPYSITRQTAPVPVPAPINPIVPTVMDGGTKIIKVELKRRATMKRVHLQPKRSDALKGVKKPSSAPQTKKARKVTLAVGALHKRMKRAKKMTRKVKEMSPQQLREHLIEKKLIKPTSKAPDAVLRQIAADAQIVAGKAL